MFTYFERLRKSFITRRKTPFPSIKMVIIFVNGLVVAAIILALKLHPEGNYAYHFGEEIGAITAVSAVFLSIAAGLAGSAWYFSDKQHKTHKFFWFLTMVAFGFLALDEQMQIHEKLGRLIKNHWLGPSQVFRNWNDAIVILYGIGALLFLAIFLATILSYPKVLEILAVSMLFYILHTAIDALTVEKTHLSVVLEESCKVFSSANFAVAMFAGLLGNVIAFCRPGHQSPTN
jgi:hypothetical protein